MATSSATKYVLSRSMTALRSAVLKLSDRIEIRHSHWSDYESTRGHYSDQDLVKKREFVGRVLETARAGWVLDVGANTGEFSEMAARHSNVVAVDLDEVSVSAIYARALAGRRAIQPLVVNIADPTPALGWKYGERKSFLARAANRFDLALMLAGSRLSSARLGGYSASRGGRPRYDAGAGFTAARVCPSTLIPRSEP